jgi:spermidine/putrescine transport system permease protein
MGSVQVGLTKNDSLRAHDATRQRLGWLLAPDALLAVAVCLVPIGALLAFSFGEPNVVTLDVEINGSTNSYRTLFSEVYRPVIARSYGLAAMAVGICVLLGTPCALAIARLPERLQRACLVAVVFPSFVSFTVRIFAWQGLLGAGGPVDWLTGRSLLFRPPAVLIGMAAAYLPLYVLPAYVALSRVRTALVEAAADLGARRWRQTRAVVLPLAMPGLVTGAVLTGVLAVGEFIVPAVLGGGKVLLLGGVLSQRGAGSDRPLGGAIVALMLTTFALGGVLVAVVRRRSALHREGLR